MQRQRTAAYLHKLDKCTYVAIACANLYQLVFYSGSQLRIRYQRHIRRVRQLRDCGARPSVNQQASKHATSTNAAVPCSVNRGTVIFCGQEYNLLMELFCLQYTTLANRIRLLQAHALCGFVRDLLLKYLAGIIFGCHTVANSLSITTRHHSAVLNNIIKHSARY